MNPVTIIPILLLALLNVTAAQELTMDCGRTCLLVDHNFKLPNLQTQQFNNYTVINVQSYLDLQYQ